MHSTIATAIVALTVRVFFAFVCMCGVAIAFAFSFAARQCSCMLRCLDCWAARRGGRSGDRTIFGRSRMLSFFSAMPKARYSCAKLDLDCTEADKVRHQIFAFHFGQSNRDRCTQLFVTLLVLWSEFKAHVNCLFLLTLQRFLGIKIDTF